MGAVSCRLVVVTAADRAAATFAVCGNGGRRLLGEKRLFSECSGIMKRSIEKSGIRNICSKCRSSFREDGFGLGGD